MNAYQMENGGISGSSPARPTIAPEIDEIRDTLSGLAKPDHRRLLIQLLSSADFDKPLDRHSVDLHRSTYDRLVKLAGRLPAAAGNLSDPSLLSAIAEWTAVNDPSLCIAALIHYGLCIGSLVELGKDNARAQEYAG
ncbi:MULTISPECIES: hypothetical protein [Burkholderia]|uniref:hypothetical protein n=1 Tax=Burkholderia TaxID=32008 RepID=UPI0012BB8F7F|nr:MULTISPECIES: hypothetical protein [Burkholderia]